MENMEKNFVTAQDVADYVGCSKGSVNFAFMSSQKGSSRLISAQLKAKILDAAKELGYDPHVAMSAGGKYGANKLHSVKRPTMKDIAQACGCNVATVSLVLNGRCGLGSKYREKVLQMADEIGYVLPARREEVSKEEREKLFRLKHNNCSSIEEENRYMETFRSLFGYSNEQIGRKTGYTIQTIRRRIGPEPADMASENRRAAQKHRAAENHRRKVYVDTHLVTTYNQMVVECAKLRSQAAELITKSDELANEIKKMLPQVKKAKLSTVQPAKSPMEQVYTSAQTPVSSVLQ